MSASETQRRRILVVDDDPRDVELTLTGLARLNLADRVETVADGAEALDYLHRLGRFRGRKGGDPVVVLLDSKMPRVSGLEVLKAMKGDDALRGIPVVAFTSSREAADLLAFHRNGGNAYVVKPLQFDEYMRVVQQIAIFWTSLNTLPEPARQGISAEGGSRGTMEDRRQ